MVQREFGALYVKDGHNMEPFQLGGGQEKG